MGSMVFSFYWKGTWLVLITISNWTSWWLLFRNGEGNVIAVRYYIIYISCHDCKIMSHRIVKLIALHVKNQTSFFLSFLQCTAMSIIQHSYYIYTDLPYTAPTYPFREVCWDILSITKGTYDDNEDIRTNSSTLSKDMLKIILSWILANVFDLAF